MWLRNPLQRWEHLNYDPITERSQLCKESFRWHEQQAHYPQTGISWDIWRTERKSVGLIEWKCDGRWSQRGKQVSVLESTSYLYLILNEKLLDNSEPGSCMFWLSLTILLAVVWPLNWREAREKESRTYKKLLLESRQEVHMSWIEVGVVKIE